MIWNYFNVCFLVGTPHHCWYWWSSSSIIISHHQICTYIGPSVPWKLVVIDTPRPWISHGDCYSLHHLGTCHKPTQSNHPSLWLRPIRWRQLSPPRIAWMQKYGQVENSCEREKSIEIWLTPWQTLQLQGPSNTMTEMLSRSRQRSQTRGWRKLSDT